MSLKFLEQRFLDFPQFFQEQTLESLGTPTNAYVDVWDVYHVSRAWAKANGKSITPVIYINVYGLKLPFFFKSFLKFEGHGISYPRGDTKNGKAIVKWSGFQMTSKGLEPLLNLHRSKNGFRDR